MYRVKDITPEELKNIQIPDQEMIERYYDSKLNLLETYQLIKERTEGFTKDDPVAREADKLLYWVVYPEKREKATPMVNDQSFELYTMSDGFTWRILSIDEAKNRFKTNKEVFGINRNEETEHLITAEKDFEVWDEFAIEHTPNIEGQGIKKNDISKIKSIEEMKLKEKERVRKLALLELELELEMESKKRTA